MKTNEIIAIEFFSGIGGLHYALRQAFPSNSRVIAAFDNNVNANKTYEENFGFMPSNKGIEQLKIGMLDKKANAWLLSPPCQPFTQNGRLLDDKDPRTLPLLNLITLLPEHCPNFIVLENVPGFAESKTRHLLVKELNNAEYSFVEVITSPLERGIPNDRKRYYLLASRISAIDSSLTLEKIAVKPLSDFIDTDDNKGLVVPERFIRKRLGFRFDIVQSSGLTSSTFTKSYGSHQLVGSGSLLQTKNFDV